MTGRARVNRVAKLWPVFMAWIGLALIFSTIWTQTVYTLIAGVLLVLAFAAWAAVSFARIEWPRDD